MKITEMKKSENFNQTKKKKNHLKNEQILEKLENNLKKLDMFKNTIQQHTIIKISVNIFDQFIIVNRLNQIFEILNS